MAVAFYNDIAKIKENNSSRETLENIGKRKSYVYLSLADFVVVIGIT